MRESRMALKPTKVEEVKKLLPRLDEAIRELKTFIADWTNDGPESLALHYKTMDKYTSAVRKWVYAAAAERPDQKRQQVEDGLTVEQIIASRKGRKPRAKKPPK